MKKKCPIEVQRLQLRAIYNTEDQPTEQRYFDDRSDFYTDPTFEGIELRVEIVNLRHLTIDQSGVRRPITITVIDTARRLEVSSQQHTVCMDANTCTAVRFYTFALPRAAASFEVRVMDNPTGTLLHTRHLHTYDAAVLGDPSEWYKVETGAVYLCNPFAEPEVELCSPYKTVSVCSYADLSAIFRLRECFGKCRPLILPELEVRLYNSNKPEATNVWFREPQVDGGDGLLVRIDFDATYADSEEVLYAEVLCMQYPIGGFVFTTNRKDRPGLWRDHGIEALEEFTPDAACERYDAFVEIEESDFGRLLDEFIDSQMVPESEEDSEPEPEYEPEPEPEPLTMELDSLTGLANVKAKLERYEKVVRFNKMRANCGLPSTQLPLHAMFLGSPGTGKTTVAERMGAMLHRAGVLSRGHVVRRERATLLGQNYSSESENTLAALEKAQGGILFIDEAYQLFQPHDPKDPGKFVIETLLTALADENRRDWMLILAGYSERMKAMFDMNPGLKSRIPESNIYVFDDFNEAELLEIAERFLEHNDYTLSADARRALSERLHADYVQRDATFGNARHVINLIQADILPAMAVRVVDHQGSLTEIQAEDVPAAMSGTPRPRLGFRA